MNKNIIMYKKQIEEYKNEMLKNYKNLVVAYEETRQLYEALIAEYEANDEAEIVDCSKITIKNNSLSTAIFSLISLDGEILYTTSKYLPSQVATIKLSNLNIEAGTSFVLKAIVTPGDDSISDVILNYKPLNTGNTLFKLLGTPISTTLKYVGCIYPIIDNE